MKIFNGYLTETYVKEHDWPAMGEIFVGLDQQNRLGPQTWLVAIQGDGTLQGDTQLLGLFWKQNLAIRFAGDITDNLPNINLD
jgi:hypothetical protein